jgi:hypothetical protein
MFHLNDHDDDGDEIYQRVLHRLLFDELQLVENFGHTEQILSHDDYVSAFTMTNDNTSLQDITKNLSSIIHTLTLDKVGKKKVLDDEDEDDDDEDEEI